METFTKYLPTKYLSETFTSYLSQCKNKGSQEKKKKGIFFFLTGDPCVHSGENLKGFELLTCKFFSFLSLEST